MEYRTSISRLFPKGFHPTDEELFDDLQLKVLGRDDECLTPFVDVCEHDEPWNLASMINDLCGQRLKEWCFIRSVTGKYKNSTRQCRTTRSGYWKVTGKERKIRNEETDKVIGTKKTLVYYTGRVPKGERTNWVMHEFHLDPKCLGKQVPLVVCRLRNKKDKKGTEDDASKFHQEGDSINEFAMIIETEAIEDAISVASPVTITSNSNDVTQDGSHSTSSIGLEAEQADDAKKETPGEYYLGLAAESHLSDFDNLGRFYASEFFDDAEMGGHFTDDDYDWRRFANWDELKNPQDGTEANGLPSNSLSYLCS